VCLILPPTLSTHYCELCTMDPFSTTASAFAVVQLSERILKLCREYATGVNDATSDIGRLYSEVTALHEVLKRVHDLEGQDATNQSALDTLAIPIAECTSQLVDIQTRLDPTHQTMNQQRMRALKWPFKRKDVNDFIARLERHKTTINMALNADQR
jgi:hypothetical protein